MILKKYSNVVLSFSELSNVNVIFYNKIVIPKKDRKLGFIKNVPNDTRLRKVKIKMKEIDKIEERKVNMFPLTVIAIGSNKNLYNIIDRFYKEKKWDYYEASKTWRDSPLFKIYDTKKQERYFKVAGILTYSSKYEENNETTLAFLKKAYKKAYSYAINDNDNRSVFMFLMSCFKNNTESKKNDLIHQLIIVLYLNSLLGKTEAELSPELNRMLREYLEHLYTVSSIDKQSIKDLTATVFKEHKDEVKRLQSILTPKIGKVSDDFGMFIEDCVDHNIGKGKSYEEINEIRDSNARSELFVNNDMFKTFNFLSNAIDSHGANSSDFFSEIHFSRSELNNIIASTVMSKVRFDYSDKETDMLLMSALILSNMLKMYRELSNVYLNDSQESFYVENKKNLEKIKEQGEVLKLEQVKLESEREAFNNEKLTYLKEVEKLKKENSLLKTEVNTLKKNEKEIIALREFAHGQSEEFEVKTIEQKDKIKVLNSVKGALFGGHPNFINKIRETIPNLDYKDTDNLSHNLNFIKDKEYVFVQTNYMNHSMYYKVMNELEKNKRIKLVYLSGYNNIDLTINEMYKSLTKVQ